MSAAAFEAFLALIYVDNEARARFLADPGGEAQRAGLDREEQRSLVAIDRIGLELAARSIALKRARSGGRRHGLLRRLLNHVLAGATGGVEKRRPSLGKRPAAVL